MSAQEKSNYVSFVTTLLVSLPYFVFILNKYQTEAPTGADELTFWASAILLMIPVRIVVEIVVNIVAAIITAAVTNGKEENSLVDERDRLIDLKGTRNSFYAFIIGFMLSMLIFVSTKSVANLFMVLIFTGFLSELVGVISQIYYYRRGL